MDNIESIPSIFTDDTMRKKKHKRKTKEKPKIVPLESAQEAVRVLFDYYGIQKSPVCFSSKLGPVEAYHGVQRADSRSKVT